ncbi:PIN domain-containing protein [Nocardia puris]|uniref:Putative nucleic acid-binding protein n=1 Tax=Nocardia puris TaxID=208602 RepID=A0A366D6J2_9NOCA|nr:hypothetical protein [Nocardia puris]RBO85585.1 putative nucleic acid-binding protein [Nocardia puris]
MNARPVIDAGPALNFLATNRQRQLIKVLGKLSTPETVEAEVLRKARVDPRFKGVELIWSKLTPNWIEISANAHAVAAAERTGAAVTVVIDVHAGAVMATAEAQRLERLRAQGRSVGGLRVVNTVGILRRAASEGFIESRGEMRTIDERLRECDDGLLPLDRTSLLAPGLWSRPTGTRI